jgi:hypothetical protein
MHVRLLTSLSSPDGSWEEGDVYPCDEQTAKRLIARGQAVPVTVGGVELAMEERAPEHAVLPRGRPRGRKPS